MRHIIKIIFLSSILYQCSTSDKSPSDIFLEEFADEKEFSDKRIIYPVYRADSLAQMLGHYLEKDTISEYGNHNFMVLTDEEKNTIIKSLQALSPDKLQLLTKKYTTIPSDTLEAIFNDSKRGSSYFGEKYKAAIYSFSEPIFLRGGKFCVFYYDYSCGELCGEGNFSIYIKTWLGWRPYVSIYSWIS